MGDVVQVSEGYARNALFPNGKAALVDTPVGKQVRTKKNKEQAAANAELEKLQGEAAALEGTELVLRAKVKEGEGEELYGSISASDIATSLSVQTSYEFKPKQIKLEKPIKQLGPYTVTVELSPEVDFSLLVTVLAEE